MVLVDGQNFKNLKKSELLHNMMHALCEENTQYKETVKATSYATSAEDRSDSISLDAYI